MASQVHAACDVRAAEDLFGVERVMRSAPHAQVGCRLRPSTCLRVDVIQLEVSARGAATSVRPDVGALRAISREDLPP